MTLLNKETPHWAQLTQQAFQGREAATDTRAEPQTACPLTSLDKRAPPQPCAHTGPWAQPHGNTGHRTSWNEKRKKQQNLR